MPDQDAHIAALVRELAETKALLEAAAAELDRRDEHLAHLRGTVPGDQGGAEQANCFDDCFACGYRRDFHAAFNGGVSREGACATFVYARLVPMADPATQGAAVAGPARECVHGTGTADPCSRCETYFQGLEAPDFATPEEAAVFDARCGIATEYLKTGKLPALAAERAAKAALEAARDNAVRERDEARADRTRALALATEHLEAKAALEVQLRDERAAHARTTELWRRDEEKGIAAERALRDERDALAAQLKAAREAGQRVVDALELHERQRDKYRAACSAGGADRFNRAVQLAQEARVCLDVARAALAAPGPAKEGT